MVRKTICAENRATQYPRVPNTFDKNNSTGLSLSCLVISIDEQNLQRRPQRDRILHLLGKVNHSPPSLLVLQCTAHRLEGKLVKDWTHDSAPRKQGTHAIHKSRYLLARHPRAERALSVDATWVVPTPCSHLRASRHNLGMRAREKDLLQHVVRS